MADGPFRIALLHARPFLIKAAVGSFFVNILMLTGPVYMLQVYDHVLASRSLETLAVITALVVALFVAMAALDFARGGLLSRAGEAFETSLLARGFDASMDRARAGEDTPDIIIRDLRQVRQALSGPAASALFDLPWTPLYLAIVFMLHWLFGVAALFGMVVLVALALGAGKMSRRALAVAQSAARDAEIVSAAAARHIAAADAMGMRDALRARWLGFEKRAGAQSVYAADVVGGLSAASRAARLLLQSLILAVGAFLVIRGETSAGAMIASSIIVGRALAPVETVTGQWRLLAHGASAWRRLMQAFARHNAPPARTALPLPKGLLVVDRVFIRPPRAAKPVVRNVSFRLEPGQSLGVIGPSAAGKSTLGRALVGAEGLVGGEIRLDGALLAQHDRDALGRHVGYMPQDIALFAGTVAENIARFTPDAGDAEIVAAAEAAGAHMMILGFPDGYETEIGDSGLRLSGGQRQRLGLARALFRDPALVVLDEPNAHLDAEGEAALLTALGGLKSRGATVVIISHRMSAVAGVDTLLFLADGEAKGFGPREEILRKAFPPRLSALPGRGA